MRRAKLFRMLTPIARDVFYIECMRNHVRANVRAAILHGASLENINRLDRSFGRFKQKA